MIRLNRNVCVTAILSLLLSSGSHAGSITGGSLLTAGDGDQFETWLGIGDQDFSLAWSGDAGVATAASFHAAVDGIGPTISIYSVTTYEGDNVRIGGYTAADWGSNYGSTSTVMEDYFVRDETAFLFNLDWYEKLDLKDLLTVPDGAIYARDDHFSTFGRGFTLFGGYGTLATCDGSTSNPGCTGYGKAGFTYGDDQGQLVYENDTGSVNGIKENGDPGTDFRLWSVNSLEVFTFSTASVPEPSALIILLFGLMGLGWREKKRA